MEEGDDAEFTVTVSGGTRTAAVEVSYEVDTTASTATATDDYTAPSATVLTIGAAETSGTIEIATIEDTVLEPDETLVLKLTAVSTAGDASVSTASATATIEDTGTVTVSVDDADAQADEGDGVSFVVELSGAVSSAVEVSYATSDGTAVAGTDYTVVPATTLTFTAGQTEKTVTVATTEDDLNEADETFTVALTVPDGVTLPEGVVLGTGGTGTIEDDDEVTVSVAGPGANVEEGDDAEFTVTVSGGTRTAAVEVSYEVDTTASTATATDDYTAPSATVLTIGAAETSGTIEIATIEDTVLEPDETLVLKLTGVSTAGDASVSTASATATIEDTGTVTVSVDDADAQADEGDGVSFVVELSGAVSSAVEVSYATSDGTAVAGTDYTAVPATTLTFTAGQTEKTVTVATTEDDLNEADETFTVALTVPDGVTLPEGVVLGTGGTGTIEDDDEVTVSVAGPGANVEEGDDAEFTVTVSGGTRTAAVEVSYEVDTTASTATATDDYTAPSATVLTIGAAETSGTIEIATIEDTVLEPDETLVLKLTAVSTAGDASVSTASATATIDDTGTVTVSVQALIVEDDDPDTTDVVETVDKSVVEEGQFAMFTVELSGAVSSDVVVSYATADVTAVSGTDYTGVSTTTLTFTAGQTSKTVTVVTLADDVVEAAETFTVSLTAPNLPTGVSLGTSSATGTIIDTDSLHVTVTADETSVDEGETAAFTVTLAESTRTHAVTVQYEVDSTSTATVADGDYDAPSGSLTIGSGSTSGTIEIAIKEDQVLESDETLVIALTSASSDGGPLTVSTTKAQVTIVNTTTGGFVLSDPGSETVENSVQTQASPTLLRSATAVQPRESFRTANAQTCSFPCIVEGESAKRSAILQDEGGNAVTLAVGETLEVSYSTSDGTALAGEDYTALSSTVTLTPAQMTFTVTFETLEDTLHEGDETFSFAIESAQLPDNSTTRRIDVAFVIRDDDTLAEADAGPTVTISSPGSFPASGRFTVNIVFSEDVTDFERADISVTNGTAANFSGADDTYSVSVTPRDEYSGHVTVTVPAGAAVATADNTKGNVAGSKSFSVNTTTPPSTTTPPNTTTPPAVTIESWADFPADGPFDVTIGFSAPVSDFTLEDIAVTNGTAGNFMGTGAAYSVEITPASNFAGDVTVTVPASSAFDAANNGNLPGSASFAVDTTPKLVVVDASFGAAAYTATEEGSPAEVTVLLSADPERTVVIPITARNGDGASDADYSGVPQEVTFMSGQTSQTFTVTATSDVDVDAGETVTLGFGDLPAAVSAGSPANATITLAGESSKTRYARVIRTLLPEAAVAMTDATVGAIGDRLDDVVQRRATAGSLSLAGVEMLTPLAANEGSPDSIYWTSRDQARSFSSAQLIQGSSFVMTLADRARMAGAAGPGPNPGSAAVWGSGDYRNLGGSEEALAWRGNMVSLHLGADLVALPNLVAGLALSRSLVGFDYTDRTNPRTVTGTFETDLLGLHPYASWTPAIGLGFWATGGLGWGGVGIDDSLDALQTSTTRLLSGAVGGSSRVLSVDDLIPGGATALYLKGEGFVTGAWAEENGRIVAQDVGVQQIRLSVEGSHEQRGLWGSVLTPALELGLRHDSGDAAQGAGVELGGEVRYVQPELGLTVEGRGRVLATHRSTTEEWGVGGRIQLEFGSGREGLSLSLAPSLGVAASGTHALWEYGVADGNGLGVSGAGNTGASSRLDAQADYRLLTMGGLGMLTPYGGLSLAGRDGRDYRAGARLETDSFNLSLEGKRSERGPGAVDHGVTVQGAVRF